MAHTRGRGGARPNHAREAQHSSVAPDNPRENTRVCFVPCATWTAEASAHNHSGASTPTAISPVPTPTGASQFWTTYLLAKSSINSESCFRVSGQSISFFAVQTYSLLLAYISSSRRRAAPGTCQETMASASACTHPTPFVVLPSRRARPRREAKRSERSGISCPPSGPHSIRSSPQVTLTSPRAGAAVGFSAQPGGRDLVCAGLASRRRRAVCRLFACLGVGRTNVAVLVAAAAQWLACAVQQQGGNVPRALAAIWAVVARGSLYITTSTGAMTVWAPPHDLFQSPSLCLEEGVQHVEGLKDCLFQLAQVGAWKEVSRSLAQPDSWAQCKKPAKWFREELKSMGKKARKTTKEAMEIVMWEVDKGGLLGRDRERWLSAGGWGERVGENGGNRRE